MIRPEKDWIATLRDDFCYQEMVIICLFVNTAGLCAIPPLHRHSTRRFAGPDSIPILVISDLPCTRYDIPLPSERSKPALRDATR